MPIERGKPGAGLVAHVLIAKYCDHLPLYRQYEIYAREGIDFSRSTMADWIGKGGIRPGGERAAAILSLIETAKLIGLNPEVYLRDEENLGLDLLTNFKLKLLGKRNRHLWSEAVSKKTFGGTNRTTEGHTDTDRS